jgi:hypothetical protein
MVPLPANCDAGPEGQLNTRSSKMTGKYTKDNLPANCVTLEQAKKDPKAGVLFYVERNGLLSVGEILPERSAHGKLQARMSCALGGDDHVREVSDWHQCLVSPALKKKAKKANKAPVPPTNVVADAEKLREELKAKLAAAQEAAGIAQKPEEATKESESEESEEEAAPVATAAVG